MSWMGTDVFNLYFIDEKTESRGCQVRVPPPTFETWASSFRSPPVGSAPEFCERSPWTRCPFLSPWVPLGLPHDLPDATPGHLLDAFPVFLDLGTTNPHPAASAGRGHGAEAALGRMLVTEEPSQRFRTMLVSPCSVLTHGCSRRLLLECGPLCGGDDGVGGRNGAPDPKPQLGSYQR